MIPGGTELLVLFAVVLLIVGPAKLPKLARSLGQAKRELAAGQAEERTES
jgi:TatA/E family protein of Tat protein translocase